MKHLLLFVVLLTTILQLALAQQQTVSGRVTNDQGEPVPYAVVMLRNTNRQTVADANGNFTIDASPGDVLQVTSVGLATTTITVTSASTVNITMQRSLAELGNVTVGTRSIRRTATETAAPVDVIPVTRVMNQLGQVDINQILQFVAPSFNSNKQSGADGSDHVDPATLRGLGPDQTLVLVNGKRRHQSSLVNIYGTRGRGNTGTDLNAIPAAAIERIEILREGASAQYGSDAIAGVINIVLKSSTNQLAANVMTGANITGYGSSLNSSKGKVIANTMDGEQVNANVNYGWSIKNNGFLNVTGDILTKAKTHRPNYTTLYPDSYRNQFGDMSLTNGSIYYNSLFPSTGSATFYSFGGLNLRRGDAFAWTRDAESERNVTAIYPNGFDPHIKSRITDGSLSFGVRNKFGEWNADFNATGGTNRFQYIVDQTLNASLEAASPRRFDAGGFQLSQYVLSANFTRSYSNVASGFNLAFGAEFRQEQYKIFAGEEGSYRTYGPVIFSINGNDTVYRPGGSQGFPGFQPKDETNSGRNNLGAYIDGELDVTRNFLITGAIRLENYSDFGFTHNYKLSTRVKLSPSVSWRSSVSTGFRAPSLPQINFSSTFTDVSAGAVVDKVIAPNNSIITQRVGIPPLKQERSVNIGTGFTARTKNFSLTVDGYYVSIKDRIVLTGAFDESDDKIGSILTSLNVGAAQFFTNAVDTRTKGIDLIATHFWPIGKGRLNTTLAGNVNDMEIRNVKTTNLLKGKEDVYFGVREQSFLLASAPKSKANLSFDYEVNKLNLLLRFNHFSSIHIRNWDDQLDHYSSRLTTDISVGYKATKNITITVGGSNIFDVYPTHQDPGLTESGGMWDAVQMGFGGAFYFARIGLKL
ncbi:TonB-dependent receptor [Aridibaculum aurantiacum]|uniref:TonB-dependent receptor n=1 Tax=Aridibaculum aurantiacum TaxID=2810307 RepID=UPI001A9744C2|nr:TonB-dependent receptor [Aridibaculum aurantiacum]